MVTKRAMWLSIGAARVGISGSVGFVSEFMVLSMIAMVVWDEQWMIRCC